MKQPRGPCPIIDTEEEKARIDELSSGESPDLGMIASMRRRFQVFPEAVRRYARDILDKNIDKLEGAFDVVEIGTVAAYGGDESARLEAVSKLKELTDSGDRDARTWLELAADKEIGIDCFNFKVYEAARKALGIEIEPEQPLGSISVGIRQRIFTIAKEKEGQSRLVGEYKPNRPSSKPTPEKEVPLVIEKLAADKKYNEIAVLRIDSDNIPKNIRNYARDVLDTDVGEIEDAFALFVIASYGENLNSRKAAVRRLITKKDSGNAVATKLLEEVADPGAIQYDHNNLEIRMLAFEAFK